MPVFADAAGRGKIASQGLAAALAVVLIVTGCATPPGAPTEPGPAVGRPLGTLEPPAAPAPDVPADDDEAEPLFDPSDPWAPFIAEASDTFDVPEEWIRAVIHHESRGRAFVNDRPIRGPSGSIGLMQLTPDTFRYVSRKYGLGSDPGDPFDNIMAGTALIREMYEEFGAPFFLAAYNCGQRCAANARAGKQPLPASTRKYLATLGRKLESGRPERLGWSINELAVPPLEQNGWWRATPVPAPSTGKAPPVPRKPPAGRTAG